MLTLINKKILATFTVIAIISFSLGLHFGAPLIHYFSPPNTSPWSRGSGPVLAHPQLELIYWGSAWSSATNPSPTTLTSSVSTLLASSYLSTLTQYGFSSSHLHSSVSLPQSSPPALFATSDVQNFLRSQILTRALPSPFASSDLLYVVMMPPNVHSLPNTGLGLHGAFPLLDPSSFFFPSFVTVHFAWVTTNSTLDVTTWIISHELVEAITDPDATGVSVSSTVSPATGKCSAPATRCEIADVCTKLHWRLDDLNVASYWSQADRRCITNVSILDAPPFWF